MHLGAKNHKSFTKFHTDTSKSGVSIVGFLTPEWKPEWEGQLKVENNTIDYEPGRFVIFDTYRQHDGNGPSEDCHLWRISINIILTHES
jgi:Rps23 Pro-64 3,4-dihydroxylase Tpa1-like proline 4-hydroxylase